MSLLLATISRQFSAFVLEELVRHLEVSREMNLVQRRGLVTVIASCSSRDANNIAGFSITTTFSAFLKCVAVAKGGAARPLALNEGWHLQPCFPCARSPRTFARQLQAGESDDEAALNEAVVQACGDMAGLLPSAQKVGARL